MHSHGEILMLTAGRAAAAGLLPTPEEVRVSRRDALKCVGLVAAAAMAGCTPLRMGMRLYPAVFARDPSRVERVLRAFVVTVVPGAPEGDAQLVRIYFDDFYDFAPHTAYFAADLCGRAARLHGVRQFEALPAAARTEVVQTGLAADGVTRRLYSGAILLAQVSFYGGIYDDEAGCPLIGFPGRFRGAGVDELTHQEPLRYLAAELTVDGNLS